MSVTTGPRHVIGAREQALLADERALLAELEHTLAGFGVAAESSLQKVTAIRARLGGSLQAELESEMRRSLERIRDEIGPYSRFVRGESAKLAQVIETLDRLRTAAQALRARIEGLTSSS